MRFLLLYILVSLFSRSYAQKIQTKAYWQQQKTESYKGKQDDIYFIDEQQGWYCNGSGKIFKTIDGGVNWKQCFEKKGTFFRCIAFVDSLNGFAGNIGTDYFPNVSDTVPLYRTADGGINWEPVTYSGPLVKGLCAIDIYKEKIINSGLPATRFHVFAGGRVGAPAFLMISHDNGKTFRSSDLNSICAYILDIKMFNLQEGIICAASNNELERSTALLLRTSDGGKSWKKVYEGKRKQELTWKCHFPTAKIGYATIQSYDTARSASQRYFAKTMDGGKTWKEYPLVNDIKVREFGIGFTNEKQGYIGAIPYGFETQDGGITWTRSDNGTAVNKFRILTATGQTKIAYAIGTGVSVNKTTITNGCEALAAMRSAYKGHLWYRNFTFSQESHIYKNGVEDTMEIWHEASSAPGKLLIKFNTKDSKNGVLFENNKVHSFKENQTMRSQSYIHPLSLAAFDVYFLSNVQICHLLDSMAYDLKIVREDKWKNKKVLVIGALPGDTLSNQIWIDANDFYLSRIIYKEGKRVTDCEFTDYQIIGGNKVATTVIFKSNGKIQMLEKYFDIKFPKELNPDLFDPKKFNEVRLD